MAVLTVSNEILKRAIRYAQPHAEKCLEYAGPFRNLPHHTAVGLFWGEFSLIIVLLTVSGIFYVKEKEEARRLKATDHNTDRDCTLEYKREQIKCLIATLICAAVGLVLLVTSAYAGLDIQFCHGEDLIVFYWSFWFLLGVGGEIAMLGIALHAVSSALAHEAPWNVAMGTPVLVVAGVNFLWFAMSRKLVQKWRRKREQPKADEEHAMEDRSATVGRDFSIGISNIEHGHIIYHAQQPLIILPGAKLIDRCENGAVIIKYKILPASTMEVAVPSPSPFLESSGSTVAAESSNSN